eukprot:jgi/Mesvir1/8445/Mv24148-RA.1
MPISPVTSHPDPATWQLGGLSSAEAAEAAMLEAVMFGMDHMEADRQAALSQQYSQAGCSQGARVGNAGAAPMDAEPGNAYAGWEDEEDEYMDAWGRRGRGGPISPTVLAERDIRKQQDEEYQFSLMEDMRKAREAQAAAEREAHEARREREAAEAAEAAQQREEEERLRQLAEKRDRLPEEPPAGEAGVTTVNFRTPDGTRFSRRFRKGDALQVLYDFVDVSSPSTKVGSYRLVSSFPRCVYDHDSKHKTLAELGLGHQQETLFLEML